MITTRPLFERRPVILMYFVNTFLRNKHFNAYLYLTSIRCETQNNKITLPSILSGYVIAIDVKKVISQANCAAFESLAFNLTSLIV